MGCCKKKVDPKTGEVIEQGGGGYNETLIIKILIFLMLITLMPLIILVAYVFIFRHFFLNKSIDISEGLEKLFQPKDNDIEIEEDGDFEVLDDDDGNDNNG